MAKDTKKKGHGFLVGMIIFALVFLLGTDIGLKYLWDFMGAYEASRPENTINAYMERLTPYYICEESDALIAKVDPHIQSEDACKLIIAKAVSGEITYARKTSECTDDKMVYVLRTGGRVIGRVEMRPQGEPRYGFAPWVVTSDEFDLSYLLTGTETVQAPSQYVVRANGARLGKAYMVESGILYSALDELYEKYEDLPTQVRYTAGPCLGELTIRVEDPQGNKVNVEEDTDMNQLLEKPSDETQAELEAFNDDFLRRYIRFLTSNGTNVHANYQYLSNVLLKGSELQKRCAQARNGLTYGQSKSDKVVSITINRSVCIGEDRYMLDVTYVVDTKGREGVVQTTNNAKYVVVDTDKGLKAEMLISY